MILISSFDRGVMDFHFFVLDSVWVWVGFCFWVSIVLRFLVFICFVCWGFGVSKVCFVYMCFPCCFEWSGGVQGRDCALVGVWVGPCWVPPWGLFRMMWNSSKLLFWVLVGGRGVFRVWVVV